MIDRYIYRQTDRYTADRSVVYKVFYGSKHVEMSDFYLPLGSTGTSKYSK